MTGLGEVERRGTGFCTNASINLVGAECTYDSMLKSTVKEKYGQAALRVNEG